MHNLTILSTSPLGADGEPVSAEVGCTCKAWSASVVGKDGAACLDRMLTAHAEHEAQAPRRSGLGRLTSEWV